MKSRNSSFAAVLLPYLIGIIGGVLGAYFSFHFGASAADADMQQYIKEHNGDDGGQMPILGVLFFVAPLGAIVGFFVSYRIGKLISNRLSGVTMSAPGGTGGN